MHSYFQELTKKIIQGYWITETEALNILQIDDLPDTLDCLSAANRIRHYFKGSRIDLCGIINAKCGKCPEDCIFCAQSIHHTVDIEEFPLIKLQDIVSRARDIEGMKAYRAGIVTSGKKITGKDEFAQIIEAVKTIKQSTNIGCCASLGILGKEELLELKKAGLESYHHNLETAESFFPNICTTHTYKERVDTVVAAKSAGLKVCSGALFGLGESAQQRVELAFALKKLDVDSVPLNFLNPVQGTKTENYKLLPPMDILKIIAMFRFVLADKDIKICGGRELNLRGLQPMIFIAGANGTMVGNYLTTQGRDYKQDLQDIFDLGLTIDEIEIVNRKK